MIIKYRRRHFHFEPIFALHSGTVVDYLGEPHIITDHGALARLSDGAMVIVNSDHSVAILDATLKVQYCKNYTPKSR